MNEHAVMTLLAIASIALAIAGFSGVVAAFGGRAEGKWQPAERFRITNMLVLSMGACLLSLVPLAEESLRIPDRLLWVIASVALLVFCSFYYVRTVMLLRRPKLRRPGVLVEWVRVVYFACLSLAIILQVLNVGGEWIERGPGPFIAGLLLMLIPAGLMFVFLVLTPLSTADL
jgi:hypothetical protein